MKRSVKLSGMLEKLVLVVFVSFVLGEMLKTWKLLEDGSGVSSAVDHSYQCRQLGLRRYRMMLSIKTQADPP